MAKKERVDSINSRVKRSQPKSVVEYDVPAGFNLNEQELECYQSYLQQRDAWSIAQRHQLCHLAKAEVQCHKMRAVIERDGELTELPNGIWTMHPAFKVLASNERLIVQLHTKLGFSIEARDAKHENERSKTSPMAKAAKPPKGPAPDWAAMAAEL